MCERERERKKGLEPFGLEGPFQLRFCESVLSYDPGNLADTDVKQRIPSSGRIVCVCVCVCVLMCMHTFFKIQAELLRLT